MINVLIRYKNKSQYLKTAICVVYRRILFCLPFPIYAKIATKLQKKLSEIHNWYKTAVSMQKIFNTVLELPKTIINDVKNNFWKFNANFSLMLRPNRQELGSFTLLAAQFSFGSLPSSFSPCGLLVAASSSCRWVATLGAPENIIF